MKKFVFALPLLFWPFFSAHSAVILKIKGRKALVDLEGVQVEKGDTFSALSLYGKPLGLLKIRKTKRGKAIAVLVKGKMGPNWVLEPISINNHRSIASVEEDYNPQSYYGSSDIYSVSSRSHVSGQAYTSNGFGFIVGSHFNFLNVSADQSLFGYSPQGSLMVDFSFMDSPTMEPSLRVLVGYRQLRVKGTNCGRASCGLILHYPGGGFLFRAVFLKRSMYQPWFGAGGFLFWPFVDKRADLGLDKKSFKSFHGALTGAIGMDFHFKGFYIPFQLDFSWINPVLLSFKATNPNSKEFKPFYIGAKLGMVFAL